jgi:DNA-directed RNA polymerase subunit RPC12/RpoP
MSNERRFVTQADSMWDTDKPSVAIEITESTMYKCPNCGQPWARGHVAAGTRLEIKCRKCSLYFPVEAIGSAQETIPPERQKTNETPSMDGGPEQEATV